MRAHFRDLAGIGLVAPIKIPLGLSPICRVRAGPRGVTRMPIADEKQVVGQQQSARAFKVDLVNATSANAVIALVGEEMPWITGRQSRLRPVLLPVKPLVNDIVGVGAKVPGVAQGD